MSSGALVGASHRIPNHANGYSRKNWWRSPSGTRKRQMDREPSAPTRIWQRIARGTPSLSV